MLHLLKQLYSAVFAALLFCFIPASGAEIDLLSLLPGHTAIAGYAEPAMLTKHEFFRQFDFPAAGVKKAAFGCDERGRRIALLVHFADENAWQQMWDGISPHLEVLPAERRILLYKLKDNGNFFCKGHFAVLAPMVAAFYADFPKNQPFKCDYSGAPANIRQALPAGVPLGAAGFPRFKDEAMRQVRQFRIFLTSAEKECTVKGEISCRKPIHASLTHFALLASCSMYLQEYCQLSPEDAAEVISRIKVRQNDSQLVFEFSDFAFLLEKIRTTVKF